MAKGKGKKGTRKAADVKIADTVDKNLDLKKAETLFDELSHVADKKFSDRMQPVKEVLCERQKGVIFDTVEVRSSSLLVPTIYSNHLASRTSLREALNGSI